jgi:hypothetical protein
MATSPNYAWAEPDNSSLVKNGAADIRTLGDAIDTSVWNIGYGQAGKNKVINGDFGIWQRGTSGFSLGDAYNADRFKFYRDGSGATDAVTQQTFTPGAAPVASYESQFYWRYAATVAGTGGSERSLYQRIEDVRTFAGQTVTFSFFAKADAARTITLSIKQNFGSGGSGDVNTSLTSQSVTTSWARYSATVAIPSISGKTVGTSSFLQVTLSFPVNVVETIDIWGVQLEYGSKATPFETATGTIQGELAACQRYYYRNSDSSTNYAPVCAAAITANATQSDAYIPLPVTMRTKPSSVDFSNLSIFDYVAASGYTISNVTINSNSSPTIAVASLTFATATAGRFIIVRGNNSASAYLGFSAEL